MSIYCDPTSSAGFPIIPHGRMHPDLGLKLLADFIRFRTPVVALTAVSICSEV